METYTRKEIEAGFLKWETESRLMPENFKSEEDAAKIDVDDIAERMTNSLINRMKEYRDE